MDRQSMRVMYSYARLFVASWLFMGGVALQFGQSPAALARDARWREREIQKMPENQRGQWIEHQDNDDARSQSYVRIFGVLMGGTGFAMALRETAYLNARYSR